MIITGKTASKTPQRLDLTPTKRTSYLYNARTGLPLSAAAIEKIVKKNLAEKEKRRGK